MIDTINLDNEDEPPLELRITDNKRSPSRRYLDFYNFKLSYLLGEIFLTDYFIMGNIEEDSDNLLLSIYLSQCLN